MNDKYLMANGLRLCYEEFGQQEDPAILLVMGLGTQMIAWPEPFCEMLAKQGFRVIRFDNRDVGNSEKIQTSKPTNLLKVMLQQRLKAKIDAPYGLRDMAKDAIGLIDALEIEKAHWVGASMGGMIAQILAAEFPQRTRSLTSIMSSSGNPNLPQTSLAVARQMLFRPSVQDEKKYLKHALKTWGLIGSPDYPPTKEELKARILRSAQRSSYPAGYKNQVAAIIKSGDRRGLLHRIKCPTMIIHGKADVLIPHEASLDIARNIPHAQLELIEGMGHDLPCQLFPRLTQLIEAVTHDAQTTTPR